MAPDAPAVRLSPDEDGSLLDAPAPKYHSGSQDDALRAEGIDPDASIADQNRQIDKALKARGEPPVPPYRPRAQD